MSRDYSAPTDANYNYMTSPGNSGSGWMPFAGDSAGLISMLMGGNYPNPADSAMPYLNNIPGVISNAQNANTALYQPYIDAGRQMMPYLSGTYQQLMTNPNAMLAKLGQGFQQSPGYQWQLNQSLGQANRAAAAGGMAGSPAEQYSVAQNAGQMANQDYYNYVDRNRQLLGMGLEGGSDMNRLGFNASSNLASSNTQLYEDLVDQMLEKAKLAYSGQANQNQAEGERSGGIAAELGKLGLDAAGAMFF